MNTLYGNNLPNRKQDPSSYPSSCSASELLAVAIFGWCRKHPDASLGDFLAMLAQARSNLEGVRHG